ncbi:MAG: ATP-dependent Clp protease adapter ClpS [Alphaproteobacteria bacterium]|nr:ATP-dependent Clp protease adapter ClpS [Alphaproteobacteria bacterium]
MDFPLLPRYNLSMPVFLPPRGAADRDSDVHTATPQGGVAVKTRATTKKPAMYKVFLLNDDYTPMDFVVQILELYFNKSREDALTVMLQVHKSGSGLCGIYSFEIAETKVAQVLAAARQAQHPLQCTMEKE